MLKKTSSPARLLLFVAVVSTFILSAACATPKPSPTPAGVSPTPGQVAPVAVAVTISNFSYSPATITVSVGTTVTWTNSDVATHNTVSDVGGLFDSGPMAQNASFSYTFAKAGTFPYHCVPHPFMIGAVIVQ